jgi:hypothetical protein
MVVYSITAWVVGGGGGGGGGFYFFNLFWILKQVKEMFGISNNKMVLAEEVIYPQPQQCKCELETSTHKLQSHAGHTGNCRCYKGKLPTVYRPPPPCGPENPDCTRRRFTLTEPTTGDCICFKPNPNGHEHSWNCKCYKPICDDPNCVKRIYKNALKNLEMDGIDAYNDRRVGNWYVDGEYFKHEMRDILLQNRLRSSNTVVIRDTPLFRGRDKIYVKDAIGEILNSGSLGPWYWLETINDLQVITCLIKYYWDQIKHQNFVKEALKRKRVEIIKENYIDGRGKDTTLVNWKLIVRDTSHNVLTMCCDTLNFILENKTALGLTNIDDFSLVSGNSGRRSILSSFGVVKDPQQYFFCREESKTKAEMLKELGEEDYMVLTEDLLESLSKENNLDKLKSNYSRLLSLFSVDILIDEFYSNGWTEGWMFVISKEEGDIKWEEVMVTTKEYLAELKKSDTNKIGDGECNEYVKVSLNC